MKKINYLDEIQKRLPDDIIIQDETSFEFNEDEFLGILSWIKNFNEHYKKFGKTAQPYVMFPIISKRLRLDFGLYNYPSDLSNENKGAFIIYISSNSRVTASVNNRPITVTELINKWRL
jgi:hypothetical protein